MGYANNRRYTARKVPCCGPSVEPGRMTLNLEPTMITASNPSRSIVELSRL
jgi:hypothetical protein